jgi:endogenous inhibitor of DNA gyrase (YacG/DUF329 family)
MIRVRCPICHRLMQSTSTAEWPEFPFCSARCRLLDLGRWLGETYVIQSERDTEPPPELADDKCSVP